MMFRFFLIISYLIVAGLKHKIFDFHFQKISAGAGAHKIIIIRFLTPR
jgi:hypothetical protein